MLFPYLLYLLLRMHGWNFYAKRGGGVWNPYFSKSFNEWEVDYTGNFELVCRDREFVRIWKIH